MSSKGKRPARAVVTDHFDVDGVLGRALIVHGGRDNYANIPDRYHSDAAMAPTPSGAGYWLTGAVGGRLHLR